MSKVKYLASYNDPFAGFRPVLLLFFLALPVCLAAQDKLNAVTSTVSDIISGTSSTFTDLTSVTMDVTDVDSVMVVAGF